MSYEKEYRESNKLLNETRQELQQQKAISREAMALFKDCTQIANSLMVIKIAMVGFGMELMKWESKTGKVNQETRDRLSTINEHLDIICKVETDNYSLRSHAEKNKVEIWKLNEIIADLQRQLQLTTEKP